MLRATCPPATEPCGFVTMASSPKKYILRDCDTQGRGGGGGADLLPCKQFRVGVHYCLDGYEVLKRHLFPRGWIPVTLMMPWFFLYNNEMVGLVGNLLRIGQMSLKFAKYIQGSQRMNSHNLDYDLYFSPRNTFRTIFLFPCTLGFGSCKMN